MRAGWGLVHSVLVARVVAHAGWWHRNVLAPGKLPLLLCFLAFVVTFAVTRTITRLIRDGRGPFRNRVTGAGLHIHHSIPGLILLIVGAFSAIGTEHGTWMRVAGVLIGVGTSLVLDEFALLLHLKDDYWSQDGQLSVELVSLTAACLAFALVGLSPVGVKDVGDAELAVRIGGIGVLVVHFVVVLTVVLKGKYPTALLGIFVPLLALVAAVRLARPGSVWFRHRYGPRRSERATRRAARFDARWDPVGRRWAHLIGGAPTPSATATSSAPTH